MQVYPIYLSLKLQVSICPFCMQPVFKGSHDVHSNEISGIIDQTIKPSETRPSLFTDAVELACAEKIARSRTMVTA